MRIGVVNVVANHLLDQVGNLSLQAENLQRCLGPDVEVVFDSSDNDDPETCLDVLFNPFLSMLDGKVVLEKLHRLQENGCDGVIVACTMDTVLSEARALLRIPIVGLIEASVLSACMAGPKFSFLVHRDRRCVELTEELVVRYGLSSRMTPMVLGSARYDELMLEAFRNPEIVRKEIVAGCHEVIDRGAHSVILASAALSTLATALGIAEVPGLGAPVFDPLCVGAQMLKYRIGLQRSMGIPPTSRASTFRQLPPQSDQKVRQALGFAR